MAAKYPYPTYVRRRPPPPKDGCEGHYVDGFFGQRFSTKHDWRERGGWNGNDRKVLPFVTDGYGISRHGYRCYHCGRMAWDETDLEFAAGCAKAWYGIDAHKLLCEAVEAEKVKAKRRGSRL